MPLLQRSAAALMAVLLSAATLTTLSVPLAQAAPPPSPDTVPVEMAEGTPHSAHTFETGTGTAAKGVQGTQTLEEVQGASSLARAGNINVHLVTVKLADKSYPETNAINLGSARNAVSEASRYWSSLSDNRLTLSIASETHAFASSAHSSQSYWTIMDTITRELGWVNRPYNTLLVFIPTANLWGGALGAGWSGDDTGGRILMPLPSSFTNNVVTHEVGHTLGLMHADSLQCLSGASDTGANSSGGYADSSCSIRQYGDTTDLMGAAQYNMPVISSSFWDYGRFGRGVEILNVGVASGRRSYTLKPWAGYEANRALKFTDPKSGEVYYVEFRAPHNWDAKTALNGNRGVKIVQRGGATIASSLILMPNTRPFAGFYSPNHAWQAGQTFTTHAGTKVHINYVNNDSAGITIDTGSPFSDINASGFAGEILWMYDRDLTDGWPDGTFRPYQPISREAVAAFMYRMAGRPAFTPPAVSPFHDVPTSHQFYREIAWMAQAGLAEGWGDGTFHPSEPISREAMAAFLHRYSGEHCNIPAAAGYVAPAASPFGDVPASAQFYKEIAWLNHTDISNGWSDHTFRPGEAITREAMAAFIHRLDRFQTVQGGCRP
jgi:hypothetical protein